MTSPDFIADQAILTISAWQRETSQQAANRLLYRDQARRWEANDNNQDQYVATLDAVRLASKEVAKSIDAFRALGGKFAWETEAEQVPA